MKKIEFKNGEERDVLIYAFRYALGRRSYAVSTVIDNILHNWETLSEGDKKLYQREIKEHEEMYGNLGDEMDKKNWYKIVDKEI